MQRFKNILVIVDEETESRTVVERAVTLAQRNQARLTIASTVEAMPDQTPGPLALEVLDDAQEPVIDIIESWLPDGVPPVAHEPPSSIPEPASEWPEGTEVLDAQGSLAIQEQIAGETEQYLQQWVDFVRRNGIPVDGRLLHGTPFLEIIREVLRKDHDLVMIAAKVRRGLRRRPFGSTAMHLMRKCPCPVWVVRPALPEGFTRVLAAVDPRPQDEEQSSVSIRIMDLATALARRQQCELVVVHTWTFPAEQSLRGGYLVAANELDKWARQAQDQHRRWLRDLLRAYSLQDLDAQVYMLKGEAGDLIPQLAVKLEVGLIVMGTVRRTGIAGLFMGSTAERILRQVRCSVLTLKPDGFVTPVTLEE